MVALNGIAIVTNSIRIFRGKHRLREKEIECTPHDREDHFNYVICNIYNICKL